MKRPFWVALGLGAGATGAVLAGRWTRKQAQRVAPATLAREAKGGIFDLGKLLSESLAEGKQAMEERERELRREHGLDPPPDAGRDEDDPPAA